jgi:Tfp pilus assembly protein PilX
MNRRIPRVVARRLPRRERGVMLAIALIVLVAMTLAGLGMMRSVDTSSIIAGNIGFKQSTVSGVDGALQAGIAWLVAQNAAGTDLSNDLPAKGYFSNVPATEPDWSGSAAWAGAFQIDNGNLDAAGNRLSYRVERMCRIANCNPGAPCGGDTNLCASTKSSVAGTGPGSSKADPSSWTTTSTVHYRITALAQGPRNSRTVVQTMVRF